MLCDDIASSPGPAGESYTHQTENKKAAPKSFLHQRAEYQTIMTATQKNPRRPWSEQNYRIN